MTPRVVGASIEQERVLRKILGGMGPTRIGTLVVEPYDPGDEYEPDAEGVPIVPDRDGVTLRLASPRDLDTRTKWETTLVADAFAMVSADQGLPTVRWVQVEGSGSIVNTGENQTEPPWTPTDDPHEAASLERRLRDFAAEAGAALDAVDILRPLGSAAAITLGVTEPHSFLRRWAARLLDVTTPWARTWQGLYFEAVDGRDTPAWTSGSHRSRWSSGGMGGTRADVLCCAPYYRRAMLDPGPPPCPIFGPDV